MLTSSGGRKKIEVHTRYKGMVSNRAREVKCKNILGRIYRKKKEGSKTILFVKFDDINYRQIKTGFENVYAAMNYAADIEGKDLNDLLVAYEVKPSGASGSNFAVFVKTRSSA